MFLSMLYIQVANTLSPKVRAFLDFLIEIYSPIPYWDEKGDHNSDAAKRSII